MTSDYVLAETLTLIRLHAGLHLAVQFGEWLQLSAIVSLTWVTPALWNDAWGIFRRFGDKDFSFVDCASLALMRRMGLQEALTLDRHFAKAGFSVLPLP